jgi:hypothetical protein
MEDGEPMKIRTHHHAIEATKAAEAPSVEPTVQQVAQATSDRMRAKVKAPLAVKDYSSAQAQAPLASELAEAVPAAFPVSAATMTKREATNFAIKALAVVGRCPAQNPIDLIIRNPEAMPEVVCDLLRAKAYGGNLTYIAGAWHLDGRIHSTITGVRGPVELDAAIADAILVLNARGIRTAGSCAGPDWADVLLKLIFKGDPKTPHPAYRTNSSAVGYVCIHGSIPDDLKAIAGEIGWMPMNGLIDYTANPSLASIHWLQVEESENGHPSGIRLASCCSYPKCGYFDSTLGRIYYHHVVNMKFRELILDFGNNSLDQTGLKYRIDREAVLDGAARLAKAVDGWVLSEGKVTVTPDPLPTMPKYFYR